MGTHAVPLVLEALSNSPVRSFDVFWSRPQSYYDSAAWRGTWEFDGGAFMSGRPIAGMYVGGLVATVGVALLLVAMLGWAVKLGREAADV